MFPAPLTLHDGSGVAPIGNHVYDTSGFGDKTHSFSEGAAAINLPATVQVAYTNEKRAGQAIRRGKFEVSVSVEDAVTGKQGNIRCYLILEVPTDITDKPEATKAFKQLLTAFVTTPTYSGNVAEFVNGNL